MAVIPGTIRLTGAVAPNDSEDTYPTHFPKYGKGGYYSVGTIAERNAISPERLETGLLVYVVAEDKIYLYKNNSWEIFSTSSSLTPIATSSTLGSVIAGDDFSISQLGVLNYGPNKLVNVTLTANTSINLGKNNIFVININISNAVLTCTNFVQGGNYIFMFLSDEVERNLLLDPNVFKFVEKSTPQFTLSGVDIVSSFAYNNALYCVMNNNF
jgi:hypothetical protein